MKGCSVPSCDSDSELDLKIQNQMETLDSVPIYRGEMDEGSISLFSSTRTWISLICRIRAHLLFPVSTWTWPWANVDRHPVTGTGRHWDPANPISRFGSPGGQLRPQDPRTPMLSSQAVSPGLVLGLLCFTGIIWPQIFLGERVEGTLKITPPFYGVASLFKPSL